MSSRGSREPVVLWRWHHVAIRGSTAADAPDGLSYPGPNLFIQGEAITPLVPTIRGMPTSYFVTPDLPVVGHPGGMQYLACFHPPPAESIPGYIVNPVTGAVTILGELIFRTDAATRTPLPTGCQPRLVTLGPGGAWVYVMDEGTNAVWSFHTD